MPKINVLKQKIFTLDELKNQVEAWRKAGDTIVFTNGCFDILHLGHITYLFQASDLATHLVIGLNSDDSVRKLKGENRPVNNEYARSIAIAALECTHAVCVFDEDTPINLIKTVSPDVLVKGGDYKPENIVGYQEVMSSGGSVKTISLVQNYSTTKILQKIFELS